MKGNSFSDDFYPLKLRTKWSKCLSVCYVVFADCRNISYNRLKKDKIAGLLVNKWVESGSQILPPYDENVSKFVNRNYMKKMYTMVQEGSKTFNTVKRGKSSIRPTPTLSK